MLFHWINNIAFVAPIFYVARPYAPTLTPSVLPLISYDSQYSGQTVDENYFHRPVIQVSSAGWLHKAGVESCTVNWQESMHVSACRHMHANVYLQTQMHWYRMKLHRVYHCNVKSRSLWSMCMAFGLFMQSYCDSETNNLRYYRN